MRWCSDNTEEQPQSPQISPDDSDIFNRPVIGVGRYLLDGIYHIESGNDFAKDSILTVQVWRSSDCLIHITHFRSEFYPTVCIAVNSFLNFIQTFVIKGFSPYNIELHCRTTLLWIHIVTFTSCCQHATTMEYSFIEPKLCWYRVWSITFTKQNTGFSMFRIWIATLNHEITNHTMEE